MQDRHGMVCVGKINAVLEQFKTPPEPKKQMVEMDHPSVRQLGTKKTITDPKTGKAYFCILKDMHCQLSHREPPRLTETWQAIGTALGTPLRQQDTQNPMEFVEEHFLPTDEQSEFKFEDKEEDEELFNISPPPPNMKNAIDEDIEDYYLNTARRVGKTRTCGHCKKEWITYKTADHCPRCNG